MLSYVDRHLFDTNLDTLLTKPPSHLQAWCDTIDIATEAASTSVITPTNGQRLLSHIDPPPQQGPVTIPPPANSQQSCTLTPVQRRIHRRRSRLPEIEHLT